MNGAIGLKTNTQTYDGGQKIAGFQALLSPKDEDPDCPDYAKGLDSSRRALWQEAERNYYKHGYTKMNVPHYASTPEVWRCCSPF